MNDPVYCPDCDGNGYIDEFGEDCETCDGSGDVPNPDDPAPTSKAGTGPDDPTLFTPTPEDPNNEETIK